MIKAGRKGDGLGVRAFEWVLALVLLGEWPANLLISWSLGELDVDHLLPGHFCDMAALLGGLALLTKKPELCELLYFWDSGGNCTGAAHSSTSGGFSQHALLCVFRAALGVVVAALYIVLGKQITPRAGAVGRALAWMLFYAFVVGTLNHFLGSNYGFLCHKPPTGSLLDVLGPWPWYVGSLVLVAFVLFTVLDLPFRRGRRG